jgi:hypothetical protein
MNSIEPIQDSILQLLLATRDYILKRTPNAKDRKVYNLAIEACREIIYTNKDMDYTILIDRLIELKLQSKVIRNNWFKVATPRQHAEMAFDHAIDIVRTLSRRFLTGVSSESKTVYREADSYKA